MDVLITSLPEKIPLDIRQLQDSNQALPAGTAYFEEKFTLGGLLKPIILGLALTIVGALLTVACLYLLFFTRRTTVYSGPYEYDFALGCVGFVFLLAGWLLLKSVRPRYRLIKQQQNGLDTRYGIFFTGDLLVSHSWFDTTIIPRRFFKGLVDNAIRYELNGSPKSFDLPGAFVGKDKQLVEAGIRNWADRAP